MDRIRVASYCRVSTDQSDQMNSFESQQRYFRAYIERQQGWELFQIYADEGITGTSTKKRAAFNQMIQDARMGKFNLILTKEVSRFSRNILDTIVFTRELRDLGVGVVFMNDGINTLDPDAELRLSIMGSIAQEESRKTSSRVKWGQMRRMEQGVVFGRSLLGYDVKDGHLTINPEGADIVRKIFFQYGVEKKGTSVIARQLQERGYRTCRGNSKWSSSHIIKILKNEKYVGDLVQKKTITPDYLTHAKRYNHGEEELVILHNHHEPIIDRELWETVQAELNRRSRRGISGVGHSICYTFSGKIRCGECGAVFVSRVKKRKDGSWYRRWSCYKASSEGAQRQFSQGKVQGCDVGKMLREELAEDMLRQAIQSLQMDTDWLINNVTAIVQEAIQKDSLHHMDDCQILKEKLEHLTKKSEAALDAFFSGDIGRDEMQRMRQIYNQEIAAIQDKLADAQTNTKGDHKTIFTPETIRQQVADLVKGEADNDTFYRNILDHMVVYRDRQVEVHLNFLPQTWTFQLEPV